MDRWIDKVLLNPSQEDIPAITLLWNALKILNNKFNKTLEKTKKCKLNLNQVIKWLYLFFTLEQITINDETKKPIPYFLNIFINTFKRNIPFNETILSTMRNLIKDINNEWLQMFFDVCIQFHTDLTNNEKKAFKRTFKTKVWNAYNIDTYNASTDLPHDFERLISEHKLPLSIKTPKTPKEEISFLINDVIYDIFKETSYDTTHYDKDILIVQIPNFYNYSDKDLYS